MTAHANAKVANASSEPEPAPGTAVARSSGKVILLGEHAVVYGVPALAVGIERGARAWKTSQPEDAQHADAKRDRLRVRGWGVEVFADDATQDLGRAFASLLRSIAPHFARSGAQAGANPDAAVRVVAESELPPGAGLGCSAALGVAIARALHPAGSPEEIADHVMAWESVFHGTASGIDAAVSARGGCVLFERRGSEKRIESIRARAGLTLCIGHSGVPSSTKTMVEAVARLRERRPEVVEQTFAGIASLSKNARLAIEAGDRFALGRLMNLNQMLLSGLFVSTEEIEAMCARARDAGALGAKLTGAGGGGCVVALVPGQMIGERVLEGWRADGFEGFITRVAGIENDASDASETAGAPAGQGAPP